MGLEYQLRSAVFYLLTVSLLAVHIEAVRQQAVGVTGQLKCGDAPAANVRVKLFDKDFGPDPDDELAQGYTDSNGRFSLEGSTVEMTNIDTVFKVYHDCDDGMMPGHRKVRFGIPNSYVTNGKAPKKKFDIGVINLETVFAEEERELIVSRRRKRRVNAATAGAIPWSPREFDNKINMHPAMNGDIFQFF